MRIPIRTKLAAALAVPLVAMVGGASYEVVQAGQDADDASAAAAAVAAETELATSAVGPGSVISNLQLERNISGVEELGLQDSLTLPVANSEEARRNTDAAVNELRATVLERGGRVGDAFAGGLRAIDDLRALRTQMDEWQEAPGLENFEFANQIFDGYTTIIATLLDDTASVALGVDDAELRTGVEMVALSTRGYELRSVIVSQMILALLVNDTSVEARTNIAALVAEAEQVDSELLARSTGPYQGIAEEAINDPRVLGEDELFRAYVETGAADLSALVAQVSSTEDGGITGLRIDAAAALTAVASDLTSAAAAAQSDAEDRRTLVFEIAAAAVLLALTVGAFASRSITKPLRSLTGQARAMAEERLPAAVQLVLDTPLGDDVVVPELAPISVRTRDEVADVAAALSSVQGAALDLAVEQAVLRRNIADSFVNMSRRNQNLLDRQLSNITELEREEADPERLEGLYRLDHLATRMRRNAESLLRLAGGGGAMTAGWSGPVAIVDVVRSALGEVEGYQRIDLRALEPAMVAGSVGTDLAHALAELVENALAFSPPEERVEVRGRRGDGGGYVLAVVDNGVGMTPEQLDVANRRLAGQESFTVAPSRYLGHYVAGHLASTHGIGIELHSTPAGGVTARIDVPSAALVSEAAGAATAAPVAAPEPIVEPELHPVADATWPEPAPVAAAPVEDLASWLVPAPADASSLLDAPAAPAPITDGSAAFVNPPPAPPPFPVPDALPAAAPVAGFGGLAGLAPAAPADGTTTASGLAKRVRGAQEPNLAPFTSTLAPAAVEPAATAEEVGSFFSAFSSGVERGLADAAAEETSDPDAPRGTSEWGSW